MSNNSDQVEINWNSFILENKPVEKYYAHISERSPIGRRIAKQLWYKVSLNTISGTNLDLKQLKFHTATPKQKLIFLSALSRTTFYMMRTGHW